MGKLTAQHKLTFFSNIMCNIEFIFWRFHTTAFCSISINTILNHAEVRRVLKPDGLYLFIEHVAASGTAPFSFHRTSQAKVCSGLISYMDVCADGSFLRLMQSVLDPLQQFVLDGCHLTRETGRQISEVGFSSVSLNSVFLSNVFLISPHVYGIACK